MLTGAGYGFRGCLVVNPKRNVEFKIDVTAGLQDINSMYITHEIPLCLHFICLSLKNYATSILLA